MSITLTHPVKGRQVTVPDNVAESYVSQGWVVPGSSTPAEPEGKAKAPRKRPAAKKGAASARADDGEAGAVSADADGGAEDQG